MERLFDIQVTDPFAAYSAPHMIALAILVCLAALLFGLRTRLRQERSGQYVRYALLAVLVLSELSLNAWYISQGTYNIKETLPLELCSISLYLCAAMLIWNSYRHRRSASGAAHSRARLRIPALSIHRILRGAYRDHTGGPVHGVGQAVSSNVEVGLPDNGLP